MGITVSHIKAIARMKFIDAGKFICLGYRGRSGEVGPFFRGFLID